MAPAPPPIEPRRKRFNFLAPAIAIIAWFVPGLGHLLLRRWARAIVFLTAVGGLAIVGYLMRGNVFPPHSEDPFGTLGFIADACSGVFYLLARVVEVSGPDVSRAMGDYGTRFIAAAGIVNVVAICDAYEIALGRRR
jgi:predicted membrane channel-forming protein YqfA (hemolysin III family)